MTKLVKLLLIATIFIGMQATAGVLEDTKKQGFVKCGVDGGLPGFSEILSGGVYKGIDVDGCRSVAAAVLGDASKVKYIALNAKERLTALQSGEIDVLYRNTTWTQSRDTSLGLNFAGVNYYDGQGFMVRKSLNVSSAKELDGASVCLQTGTTTELNVADYFRTNGMKYKTVSYDTNDQVVSSYENGRCDILTSDASQLYGLKTKLKDPAKHIVLPEIISKEPLGPVVRQGDDEWFNIVKWSYNAVVAAEELGVTSANVDKLKTSTKSPAIKRLLGTEGKMGANLGLNADFAYQIIKQVGNYGEIFERNIGINTSLKMERGINALWTNGGLQYSPPFR
ncbi:MAG: amino acid ABC transporter substrate-binding protein [Sulfurospirillum sp.]|nr:amino acid ABC transporter substrate-binding protein [Sulfurospirillum sp.]MBL0702962.1 amino acid ABC transporter substrate-binding protein [Sulfurospirillum sp.]